MSVPGPRVYFIRATGFPASPVKIGCSSWPENRLATLSAWSPYPLEVVASIPGDMQLERRLHSQFIAQHTHREWFKSSPALLSLIEKLKAGEPIEGLIDMTIPIRDIRRKGGHVYTPERRKYLSYAARVRFAFRPFWLSGGAGKYSPHDVYQTLNRWSYGHEPTSAEIERLEVVIASPAENAVSWAEHWHESDDQQAEAA